MAVQGIPVVCECTNIVCFLPSPEYDNIPSLDVQCRHCGGINTVTTSRGRVVERQYKGRLRIDQMTSTDMQSRIPEASACIQEAVLCVNYDAFRAAMVMARAALEVTLSYFGFNDYELKEKVNSAVTAGVLTNHDATRATNVRLIGNFGAHGSVARYVPGDEQMTVTDAKYAVEASSELIKKLLRARPATP